MFELSFLKILLVNSYVLQLLEGRKQAGGKVEVKIRLRDALGQKQYSEMQEKWLVIDG